MNDIFTIPIFNSDKVAIIDIESVALFEEWDVNLTSCSLAGGGSVMVYPRIKNKKRCTALGRFLLQYNGPCVVDHIDRNKLNNRIHNLRVATRSENTINSITKSEHYRGVTYIKDLNRKLKYRTNIRVDCKQLTIGYYRTEEEAALAYNEAAIKYHGEFAMLNVINKDKNPDGLQEVKL